MKLKIPSLETKYKIILVIGALLLIYSIFSNLLLRPKIKGFRALNEEVQNLRQQVELLIGKKMRGEQYAKLIDELKLRTGTIKQKILNQEKLLPTKDKVSEIWKELTDIAIGCAIEVVSLNPKPTRKRKAYEEAPLEMNIVARFSSLFEFLNKASILPFELERLQIESSQSQGHNLNIKLSLTIYYVG